MATRPKITAPMRPRTCHDCAFCITDPGLWLATLPSGFPVAGMCANHSAAPGRWRQIPLNGPCRNFRPKPGAGRLEPPPPPNDQIRYIPLTRGRHAIVDAKNYEWLSQHKWSLHDAGKGKTQYAVRGHKGRKIFMHREIMKPPSGMVVDHINRNGIDNREDNLRNCTRLQNLQNRYWHAGQSQFRGVCPQGDKWMATVGYNNETVYVGLFDDEIEAARARPQSLRTRRTLRLPQLPQRNQTAAIDHGARREARTRHFTSTRQRSQLPFLSEQNSTDESSGENDGCGCTVAPFGRCP